MLKELWKNIEGYKGLYQISNIGRVKSFKHNIPKILKQRKNKKGYWYVNLCINGKYKSLMVHRLVALHFFNKSSRDETINHIDGNKNNNNISNLEWVTLKRNREHAKENHLLAVGEKNGRSKLKERDVLLIRKLYKKTKTSFKFLGDKFGVSKNTIADIIYRKKWKYI